MVKGVPKIWRFHFSKQKLMKGVIDLTRDDDDREDEDLDFDGSFYMNLSAEAGFVSPVPCYFSQLLSCTYSVVI
jgi:hypothetical protein